MISSDLVVKRKRPTPDEVGRLESFLIQHDFQIVSGSLYYLETCCLCSRVFARVIYLTTPNSVILASTYVRDTQNPFHTGPINTSSEYQRKLTLIHTKRVGCILKHFEIKSSKVSEMRRQSLRGNDFTQPHKCSNDPQTTLIDAHFFHTTSPSGNQMALLPPDYPSG